MKISSVLTALVGTAAAVPATSTSGLDVSLKLTAGTTVKATVKNSGTEALRVLKTDSILGKAPSKKVQVTGQGKDPQFIGGIVHVIYNNLPADAFVTIAPGETLESEFDVAELYDLSKGGDFSISSKGALQIAGNDLKIASKVQFETNVIKTHVDAAKAAQTVDRLKSLFVKPAEGNSKRATARGNCEGDRYFKLDLAYNNAHTQAWVAANEARNGPSDRLEEFFKTSSGDDRNYIAGVYDRAANQLRTLFDGGADVYCHDPREGCAGGGAAAVTYPWIDTIAYCDYFFDSSSDLADGCHWQDRAQIVLHETTHTNSVAATDDHAYFYEGIRGLNRQDAMSNADTYAEYASSFWEGCYNANIAQVYACTDRAFQGICTGIRMPVGYCANIPNEFNDKISSMGGSYTGVCYGYKDENCTGDTMYIQNGHEIQYNDVPPQFNDVFSSFRCV